MAMKIRKHFIIFLVSGFGMGQVDLYRLGIYKCALFSAVVSTKTNRSNMEMVSLNWNLSSVRVFFNILSTFALTCLWIFF
jgi:hypothetical protein